jgi:hypothetical protein
MPMRAPIILFAYNRPKHVKSAVEALLKNPEAPEHDLIVFSDAARSGEAEHDVASVRGYLREISGFRSVRVVCRSHNFGLAKSIIEGVTEVLLDHERVIVLEDDIVVSVYFLSYMNQALDRFSNNDIVVCIHGYVYPVDIGLPDAFFLRGADCWAWATWRRAWRLFNPDGKALMSGLREAGLVKQFDFNGAFGFSTILQSQIDGKNDSWAIRWNASAFLAGGLTLYPGRSLVKNIGHDDSGIHCGQSSVYDVKLTDSPIVIGDISVEVSEVGFNAFEKFFTKIGAPVTVGIRRRLVFFAKSLRALAKRWFLIFACK